jgi:hypothetical protein
MSVGPPAAKPSINRTGLAGQSAASATHIAAVIRIMGDARTDN